MTDKYSAKEIVIKPISQKDSNAIVKKFHYSGSVTNNSQLNFGVFLENECLGAMQFGPSMDKKKTIDLVSGTKWDGFLELNRMAFSNRLPRFSESRAIGVAMRIIRKNYPQIEWVISFADATQCGDGTIYRASGFLLTGIKKNQQIVEFPDGYRVTRVVLTNTTRPKRIEIANKYGIKIGGSSSMKPFLEHGAKYLDGYQLRYVYFINPKALDRLSVPVIPFSKIKEIGADMYLGKSAHKAK